MGATSFVNVTWGLVVGAWPLTTCGSTRTVIASKTVIWNRVLFITLLLSVGTDSPSGMVNKQMFLIALK
jgi:hypothetical protein